MEAAAAELEKEVRVCEYGKLDGVRCLLRVMREEGAEQPGSDVQLPGCGLSVLELCVQEELNDVVNMILAEKWGTVDVCVGFPCTALCKACYNSPDNAGLIKVLLYHGSNPNATITNDMHSASCLISAVINAKKEVVALLLQHDVDIYYEWRGQNALSMALDFNRLDLVDLIERHAMAKALSARQRRLQEVKPDTSLATVVHIADTPVDFTKTLETQSILTGSFVSRLTEVDWVYKAEDLEIKSLIGVGGFGSVYKAVFKETGDAIACKTITCKADDILTIFKEEVALMSKLRHKNVVLFLGAVLDLPSLCILTELMHCNLADRLLGRGPVTWVDRLRWARDIAKGMTYLHSRNPYILHRDLKSLNVLLSDSGDAKLCDFGMAKARKSTMQDVNLCGSPGWMAPEVLRGEPFTKASDIYSYSVIMWEILTRQTPWPDQTLPQLVGLVGFSCRLLALPSLPPNTPQKYLAILEASRCKPSDRMSFKNITAALEEVIVGEKR